MMDISQVKFAHNGTSKTLCDCAYFVAFYLQNRSIITEIPEKTCNYPLDWARGETPWLLNAIENFIEINNKRAQKIYDIESIKIDDIILMKHKKIRQVHHCGIALSPEKVLHCYPKMGVRVDLVTDEPIKWFHHAIRLEAI